MNCCKIKKVLIILFILLGNSIFIPQNLFSDSFRVKKVVFLDMEKDNTKNSDEDNSIQQEQVKVGINDAICIKLPKDLTFIQGIELNIKIPSLLARFPNTVIYSIYNNVSPVPSAKNIDFTGKELFTGVYPGQLSLKVLIPLVKGNTISTTPYAVKTYIPEYSRNFIFIRNQLAMKGVPNEALKQQFIISAKPILMNKGKLTIKTNLQNSNNLEITVDDKTISLDQNGSCYLKPGQHTIGISADSVRNESRTCIIEVAKETILDINLKSTEPLIYANIPKGTIITENNREIKIVNNSFSLAPGEHTLVFSIGGQEIVKNITIVEGRNYSINITFNAIFTEN